MVNFAFNFLFGHRKVIVRLKINPEFWCGTEIFREPSDISEEIPRRSRIMSYTFGAATLNARANLLGLRPNGTINSSRSISPGWIGFNLVMIVP